MPATADPPTEPLDADADADGAAAPPPRTGLNLAAEVSDDGWHTPPPVRLADGTAVQLYKDGQSLSAMYDAIGQARRRVCLEFYILAGDETGRAFVEMLCHKARSGVAVWFLYDSFGSLSAGREAFERMARAGVRLAEFHPVLPWRCRFGWRPWSRDHRKLVVVDGEVAGLGGQNLADEYAGPWVAAARLALRRQAERQGLIGTVVGRAIGSTALGKPAGPNDFWRDNAIGLRGPAVRHLERSFARTWQYVKHGGRLGRAQTVHNLDLGRRAKGRRVGKQRAGAYAVPVDPTGPSPLADPADDFGLLASVPTLSSPLRPFLYQLLRESRRSIRLTMGYFGPDDEFVASLCGAARRGVDCRLVLAGESDIPLLKIAARAFYPQMLDAGVKIFERQHVNLHAKCIVLDERVCVVGSANLDYRSIETNFELSAVVRSEALGRQMHDLFDNDVRFSEAIDPGDWHQRPWRDRLVRWAVSRMRYLL